MAVSQFSCPWWWNKIDSNMFITLFNEEKGDECFSLAATLVKDAGRNNLTERENAWLAGTMYAAGAETTAGVLTWFMLAMIAYPETQKRAQAELDAVIGRDRIPIFADRDRLPYICAMIKEILRWHPVDPVGLPHCSIEDDWYKGYFIPKGSICIANVWHLNRDPDIYGLDADHFNPSRHLDEKGQIAPGPPDTKEESHVTYGFGRRLCVGRHVANQSLFIDISLMLWALNIENTIDPNGNPTSLDLDGVIDDGLVVRPMPFQVKITPRFPESTSIIEREMELGENLIHLLAIAKSISHRY
ncbi:cytochrome P450 [Dendrothele bispora CBS 962.96]|uniref:Cytochrome P450 n=1 Tax=Dendrothele bispora (strain CBS 962.96) TaxID=1314807 RepID=A0A4S8L8Y1_DENBC|nr:cytochrome P450 [Dendrothele bispora CBS 962.96]